MSTTTATATPSWDPPTSAMPGTMAEGLRELDRQRRRFVFTAAGFLLIFNLAQPVLSVTTHLLDRPAIGVLTWGWIYAFAQFPVPIALLHVYLRKARGFEARSRELRAGHHG